VRPAAGPERLGRRLAQHLGPVRQRRRRLFGASLRQVHQLFLCRRPQVPLLLLSPPFFPIINFFSTILLTGMTGICLHVCTMASDFTVSWQAKELEVNRVHSVPRPGGVVQW
jgi:hypothetical protein